ncbi:MAG: armadillo-type protein [Benjaminiella poitrasii]|nr:MAG: armadillo-type protein [Benjaminiella poitrasii]
MLERDHHDLLILMTKGITSSEAALRCACIEACRSFLVCDQGQIWLLQNEEVTSFIMLALLDQSSYVVAEACRLFANLIEFNLTTLMDVMDPSNLIRHLLQPGTADSKQTVAALDFCWTLLHSFISLLCLSDRIVRARVVEILSILFIWDKDPLQTLNLETCHSDTNKAYMVMLKTVKGMIKEAKKLDDLMTAISLLDASFALLTQINQTDINPLSDMAYHVLYALISLCVNHEEGGEQDEFRQVKKFIDTNRTKANLLQLLLRTINTLVRLDTRLIQESNFSDIVFNVLENKMLYSDSRVLKSALILLTSTLWHANRVEHILSKTIESLVKMSDDIGLDCKSLIMVLDTLNTLLGHDQIGLLGHRLAESLSLKFLDTEWDVRDASVHFVGQLFEAPFVKTKIQFALAFNLPLDVFERIHDSEAYVRASAVEVLQMMMASKEGWDYVQQHKVSRELAAKLPSLLHDTEAFVRRAALDAIICLVKNRFCQGMLMEIKDQPNSLK